ncbi:MAG: hypothetical protein HXS53_08690 [Theionarchaea archaeon]|nr:hypothetical protein [Theionarchaea archaeon]
MKRMILIIMAVFLFLIPASVGAVEMYSGDTILIDTPITDDVIITGSTITINAPITGDVIIAGGIIKINARIDGDLIVAAGQVEVNEEITGKILAGCGSFDLRGNAEKAIIFAGEIMIYPGCVIERYVIAAGGTVTNAGHVKEEFYVGAEEFKNTGTVGELKKMEYEPETGVKMGAIFKLIFRILSILTKIGFLILGILFIRLFPKLFFTIEGEVKKSPIIKTVVGFILLLVTTVIIVLLMITVVGLPLGVILGLFLLMIVMVAGLFVSYSLGDWILQRLNMKPHEYLVFTLGFLIINILYFIPYVGIVTRVIVVSLGFGALFYALKNNWGTLTARP